MLIYFWMLIQTNLLIGDAPAQAITPDFPFKANEYLILVY